LISKIEQPEEEDEEEVSKDEHRSLRNFLEQLRERHGVDFTSYKMPTISRRLKRRMVATGTQSIAEYSAFLEGNPQEYRQLINTFLIKVNEFFRDPDLFAYLKEEVFPDLLETARREGRLVRCSPYCGRDCATPSGTRGRITSSSSSSSRRRRPRAASRTTVLASVRRPMTATGLPVAG
jgi:hypothetical protein